MMRRLALAITLAVAMGTALGADAPEVDQRIDGFYWQTFTRQGIRYVYDPYARLCFVTIAPQSNMLPTSIAEIPCAKLAQRREWAGIAGR